MTRALKHLVAILVVLIVAGCAGAGGCSGCAGCGVTPLPGGFAPQSRIENAGSVQLTASGLGFLQQNIGTLAGVLLGSMGGSSVITFEVPSSSQMGITVCPDGPKPNATPPECVAEVDIAGAQLQIQPTTPHNLHITGPLPIRLQDLPIDLGLFGSTHVVLNGNDMCPGDQQTFAQVGLDVMVSVEVDTDPAHIRQGYSRVRVESMTINDVQLEDSLHFCGGFIGWTLEQLKGTIMPLLLDPLLGTLTSQIDSALCQAADPTLNPPCPTGTYDVAGTCRYGATDMDECVSTLLGTEGHLDLSSFLASISPGTRGGSDIVFAVGGAGMRDDGSGQLWGDLNPVSGGATLGMYGGAEPMPISGCVKFSDMAMPSGIPIPDELTTVPLTDWPMGVEGPHVGIALSERFTNYMLNSIYNSGALCLGITTDAVPQLSSQTLGLLAPSLPDLGLQRERQTIALVVRPGAPPSATFGNGTDINTDPVIRVKMDQASFDFYIWSLDRYVRFMTATFDLDVPVNLVVTPDGLLPVLDKIGVTNGVVINSGLLKEDPAFLASALQDLIGGLGSQFLGGVAAIDLNSMLASLGMTLTIPESVDGQGSPGLRRLTKNTDNFLGIFATLGIGMTPPTPGPLPGGQARTDTQARVIRKLIDPAGLKLPTLRTGNEPEVTLQMGSPDDTGAHVMEYSYRVDRGMWHPFTRDPVAHVRDGWLRLQGRHVIAVQSRIAGQPMSLDPTPVEVEVLVDVEPPAIVVGEVSDGKAALQIKDVVSDSDRTLIRVQLDGREWSDWTPASAMTSIDVGDATEIAVEAKDEEGNLGTAQLPLIRGGVGTAAGCACKVVGVGQSPANLPWALAVVLAGIVARLARRGARGDRSAEQPGADSPVSRRSRPARPRSAARAGIARVMTGLATMAVAGSWAGCSCGDDLNLYKCEGECTSLVPGLIGAYTSVAVSGSDIWVAGYLEANWDNDFSWGDLVVGKWDGTKVGWAAIDGVPAEPKPDGKIYNLTGLRGGQAEPGDDVGLWTSIAIHAGHPAVAYYDRTHRSLKFARHDGKRWAISTVEQKDNSDIGRYAKLIFDNGVPSIVYLSMEPGQAGAVTSKVRIATGAGGQWTFEDVAVNSASPCREVFCSTGTVCVADTGLCTDKLTTCAEKCAAGTACVDQSGTPACVAIFDKNKLDTYPEATGAYIAVARHPDGGFGIAYYDRPGGNLHIASKSSGQWSTLIVDGEAADGTDTGDMGIGASLFIDDKGDWHLGYVDGHSEGLRYAQVTQGTTVKTRELIDDGLGLGTEKFDDGLHLVGDDSSLWVTPSGEVRVSYQDATAGTLRYAVGTPEGDTFTWSVKRIDQTGFAGAFSRAFEADGKMLVANWWRVGGESVHGDVTILSP